MKRTRLRRVSKKTRTVRWPLLQSLRVYVLARANGRCECCRNLVSLVEIDVHHVIKRSQGGTDTADNAVALCRSCHERTDWPYAKGRLVIRAGGYEHFTFEVAFQKAP